MWVSQLLKPEACMLLSSTTKNEALTELVESVDMRRHSIGRDEILQRLLAREELMSTGIGLGLGIPHIRAAGIGEPVLRLGISPGGIDDYEAIDGLPVRLLFLIMLKEDQQREHVRLLSEIVSLMKDEKLRTTLINSRSGDSACMSLTAMLREGK
jgi:nitrogen PTS system EIIA component